VSGLIIEGCIILYLRVELMFTLFLVVKAKFMTCVKLIMAFINFICVVLIVLLCTSKYYKYFYNKFS
jgi:hypothetical protein